MKYYCNPVNYNYKYQFNRQEDGTIVASREGADPSMVCFHGKYLIFPSMTCGFLHSDDLVTWNFHPTKALPVYDYAPDVCVVGDWLYFCASSHDKVVFYRTKDPFTDAYEQIDGQHPYWDPKLFRDEDGRLYMYHGSSTSQPLFGVELDGNTLQPMGEQAALAALDPEHKGFERNGENHIPERTQAEIDMILAHMAKANIPPAVLDSAIGYIKCLPYAEGAWMTKVGGKYYLQYGTPGSRFNSYGDAVYVAEKPLGPFTLAQNNPYSYKPGGFLGGAGHGSTMEDKNGNFWHIATTRICVNHNFERRLGLWPAGFDADGVLFCNQRYGDWVYPMPNRKADPWTEPEWMLLSYGKKVTASSGVEAEKAVDEDIRTWWKAADHQPGQWIQVDLGGTMDVRAVQINFADDHLTPALPDNCSLTGTLHQQRWIDEAHGYTRWKLEASLDGKDYFLLEDKTQAETDLPHDLVVKENGIAARYIRLTIQELPYGQVPCVSGLRVFGLGHGTKPDAVTNIMAQRSDLDIEICWDGNAMGYTVLWGHAPDKLYHSYQVFENKAHIAALVKDQPVYVRIDGFNENGITKGIEIIRK